jgi:hypothetical protein
MNVRAHGHTASLNVATVPEFERMAAVGLISRAIDKLPTWAKLICWILVVIVSMYCILHYGFVHFLLRVILSPDL